jgi:SnoaL-like domain
MASAMSLFLLKPAAPSAKDDPSSTPTHRITYFRCVDTHDWSELATLFCVDAHLDTRRTMDSGLPSQGSLVQGREAVLRYIVEGMTASQSVHHGHGHEITLDSATEAHGIVTMEDRGVWPGPPEMAIHGFGHYHEIYRVEEGNWRIWRSRLVRLPFTLRATSA